MEEKKRKNKRRFLNAKSVRFFLADVATQLQNDEINESKARALAYVMSIMLSAFKTGELEERLNTLENQMDINVIYTDAVEA